MHQFSGKLIIIMILFSCLLGGLVLLFKDDYTIAQNVKSNRDYYPSVKIAAPASGTRPPARRTPARTTPREARRDQPASR